MKVRIPNAVTTRFARQALVLEKHSPQLLFGAGLVLMGGTVVSACRGTLRLEATIDGLHRDLVAIEKNAEVNPEKYSDREIKKLQTYVYARNVVHVGKLYAPAIVMGSLAVMALTSSHRIMSRRNAGLSAALAATDRAFRNYRARVEDEYGEDKELELYRGSRTENRPVFDDEGRATKSKKKVVTGGGKSSYAAWWGKDSTYDWSPESGYNLARLSAAQEHANLKLRARGHIFLSEVLDAIGLDRTPASTQVGWLYNHPEAMNEYVDFGIFARNGDGDIEAFLDFVQGHENGIWLDFNVDGEIWNKI